ncbi:hypothetical protein [Duganella violaceipulchra]|uniref:Uncharacterized protein n=1 Tax=Duganella violaceipulchra TaxID=2849652 RepID=A0AA41L260_9BURK|nr:hypothetical protein [Duganella violaceicalia]MBV6319794.1 hypothetical protein [Duganella violaceicalia]MCP2006391.1 hypothetical protein [Duganella violaceicalia]
MQLTPGMTMPFRVGQYVTVDKGRAEWHGEIIARLPGAMFEIRLGGTSGSSMISSQVAQDRLSAIVLTRPEKPSLNVVRRVYVGMLLENTDLQSKEIEQRFELVKKALCGFEAMVEDKLPICDNQHRLRGIFLAPEYMFARHKPAKTRLIGIEKREKVVPQLHATGDTRHLDEIEMQNLCRAFAALSATLKNILIVPGTIAWRRSITHCTPEKVGRYRQAVTESSKFRPAPRDLTKDVPDPEDVDLRFVAPPLAGTLLPQTYKERIASASGARYFARNTAFVYYNGINVAKYHKIGDFHEVLGAEDTVHIPSVQPCRFDCGGTTFGMSICADDDLHAGPFGQRVQIQRTLAPVDFHIKLSASCEAQVRCAYLLPTGFLLSSDSQELHCKVINASGSDIASLAPEKVGIEGLRVFAL